MAAELKKLPLTAQRELVVIAHPEVELRADDDNLFAKSSVDIKPLADFLSAADLSLRPLFGVSEERLKRKASSIADATGIEPPDLSLYYRVAAPDEQLESLAAKFRKQKAVQAAYVKPAAELPVMFGDIAPAAGPAPTITPLFIAEQGYLRPAAAGGIDAEFAWTREGGKGRGVKIIDIEYAWRFSHDDLLQNQGGVVGGTPLADDSRVRSHGTAVLGIFSGDDNEFGITGICPEANVSGISVGGSTPEGWGTSAAIRLAADKLDRGDIILIELHRAGPRNHFTEGLEQGHIPIEWWPDDFDAIKYATSKGVIVVEAGGNGGENLDDDIYQINPDLGDGPIFQASWRNPFRREQADSGAIVVGAGAKPPIFPIVTPAARSRLVFSNFGSIMDAQGWGVRVTTCGYGDRIGGTNEDIWYTRQFGGTSSASPMIVGALSCVQGILKAAGKALLDPAAARRLLLENGAPQQNGPAGGTDQRIGSLPDLHRMIEAALAQQ